MLGYPTFNHLQSSRAKSATSKRRAIEKATAGCEWLLYHLGLIAEPLRPERPVYASPDFSVIPRILEVRTRRSFLLYPTVVLYLYFTMHADWVVVATVVAAASTVVYVVVSIFMLFAIRGQAKIAAKTAEAAVAAEAAWLKIDVEQVPVFSGVISEDAGENFQGTKWENTTANFRLICTNMGRTPAWTFDKRAKVKIFEAIPDKPDLSICEIVETEPEFLGSGEATKPQDVALTTSESRRSGKGNHKVIAVYGFVNFRDAFGRDRKAVFGYIVTPDFQFRRLMNPEWNKNT